MLKSVEVENFLSHVHTRLDFDAGVTVFVGPNGAGKSSIIDAITFALFGEHLRRSTKFLLRRGSSQAYARVVMTLGNREIEAARKIDASGTVSAQLYEREDGQAVPLAAGERKQFGESMTRTVESMVGLDFEKLKVASIVQQGELQSIIEEDPRKFKELVNAIIGIDKLDVAFEAMKRTVEDFRKDVRARLGHDDAGIGTLQGRLEFLARETGSLAPKKGVLEEEKARAEREFTELQRKIESESPKESKIKEMERRKDELARYLKNAVASIKGEIAQKGKRISECSDCLMVLAGRGQTEAEGARIKAELEGARCESEEVRNMIAKISGQQEIANKLKITDGRCPVCDSRVDRINPLFEKEHLRTELQALTKRIEFLAAKEQDLLARQSEADLKMRQVLRAESVLAAHQIRTEEELLALRTEVQGLKTRVADLPAGLGSPGDMARLAIDEVSGSAVRAISILADETRGFDMDQFLELKRRLDGKRAQISSLDHEIGSITTKLGMFREESQKVSAALEELQHVERYVATLETIRSQIYNRDGPVATSLRSWALGTISQKASEYIATFNVKIQRITLEDKVRDVRITCHAGSSEMDLESLSGGEKVTVALALRLGMAHLMGSSHLNFIILDEPTTHLDQERRKSLVSVLSQAFESNVTAISQFIIITHDAEIFENSNIDAIYEFRSSPDGTRVNRA